MQDCIEISKNEAGLSMLSNSSGNGNTKFYTSNIKPALEDVKYKKEKKFVGNIMLWLCFSEKGCSKPFLFFLNKGN